MVSEEDFGSDYKFDVWAIGIMLFKLMSGKFPFDGRKKKEIIDAILNQEPNYNLLTESGNKKLIDRERISD